MGLTHSQRKRLMERGIADGQIAPDRSQVLHTFADGWTINLLSTAGDVRREGFLMRSCLPKYAGDRLLDEPGLVDRGERADEDQMRCVAPGELETLGLDGIHVGCTLASLRDPMNLPHLTFWYRPDMYACSVLGAHNAKPKAAYQARLGQWLPEVGCFVAGEGEALIYGAMHGCGQDLIARVRAAARLVAGSGRFLALDEMGQGHSSPAQTSREEIGELSQLAWWDKICRALYCMQAARENRRALSYWDAIHALGPPASAGEAMRWPGERVHMVHMIEQQEANAQRLGDFAVGEILDLHRRRQLTRWRRWSQRAGQRGAFCRKR